jgi:uncharacterized protein (TIGR02284 family)
MDSDEVVAILNHLIETCKDGEAGFRTCADNIDSLHLKTYFENRAHSCASAAEDLEQLVRSLGSMPTTGSSLSAALHRRWVDVKALVTGRDEAAILEECERGEDLAVNNYRDAMQKSLPPDVRIVVERQYKGVLRNHAEVRQLRDEYRSA